MSLGMRYSFWFTGFVAGLLVCAPGMAGCASPQQREGGGETAWEKVEEGSTAQGIVTPEPESAAKAPSAPLSPAEMDELLLRKYEMRERMAKQVNNNPPGPPGLPDEPVPETTLSEPPPNE